MRVKRLEELHGRRGINVHLAFTSTDRRLELHLGNGENGKAVSGGGRL